MDNYGGYRHHEVGTTATSTTVWRSSSNRRTPHLSALLVRFGRSDFTLSPVTCPTCSRFGFAAHSRLGLGKRAAASGATRSSLRAGEPCTAQTSAVALLNESTFGRAPAPRHVVGVTEAASTAVTAALRSTTSSHLSVRAMAQAARTTSPTSNSSAPCATVRSPHCSVSNARQSLGLACPQPNRRQKTWA